MIASPPKLNEATEECKESKFEIFCSVKNYLFTPLKLFLFEVIAYLNFFLTQWPHKSLRHCLNANKVKRDLWIKYDNNNPITLLLTILILFHFITSPLASWQAYKVNKYLKGHYYYVKPRQEKEVSLMHINFIKLLSLFTCPLNKDGYIYFDYPVTDKELQKIQELLQNPNILQDKTDYDDEIQKRISLQLVRKFTYKNSNQEKRYRDLINAYYKYPLQKSKVLGKLILQNLGDENHNDLDDYDECFDANNFKTIKFSSCKDYADMNSWMKLEKDTRRSQEQLSLA